MNKPKYQEGQKIKGWTVKDVFSIGGTYEYRFKEHDRLIKEKDIKP